MCGRVATREVTRSFRRRVSQTFVLKGPWKPGGSCCGFVLLITKCIQPESVCSCSGHNSHKHIRYPINLVRLLCMMIFIQLWCPLQQRQFTVILITDCFISQQNQFLSAQISLLFFYSTGAPLLDAAFSALELLFYISIPFELLASHPSLGSCNIFYFKPPPSTEKGDFSVNKKACFPSKPVECSSLTPIDRALPERRGLSVGIN